MRLNIYKKVFCILLSCITFLYLYKFLKVNQTIGIISKEFQSDDKYIVIENIIKDRSNVDLEDNPKIIFVEKLKPYCNSTRNPTVFKLPDSNLPYNSGELLMQKGWDNNHENYYVILTNNLWDNIGINIPNDCEVRVYSSAENLKNFFKRDWLLRSIFLKNDFEILENSLYKNNKFDLLIDSSKIKNNLLTKQRESPYSYLNNLSLNKNNFDSIYQINSNQIILSLPFNRRDKKIDFYPISFKVLNTFDIKNNTENIKSIYSLVGSNWYTKKDCFLRNKNNVCKILLKKLNYKNIFQNANQEKSLVTQELKFLQARIDGSQPISILFINR